MILNPHVLKSCAAHPGSPVGVTTKSLAKRLAYRGNMLLAPKKCVATGVKFLNGCVVDSSEPVASPNLVLLLGASEFEVNLYNILEPFLKLWLLEARSKACECNLR